MNDDWVTERLLTVEDAHDPPADLADRLWPAIEESYRSASTLQHPDRIDIVRPAPPRPRTRRRPVAMIVLAAAILTLVVALSQQGSDNDADTRFATPAPATTPLAQAALPFETLCNDVREGLLAITFGQDYVRLESVAGSLSELATRARAEDIAAPATAIDAVAGAADAFSLAATQFVAGDTTGASETVLAAAFWRNDTALTADLGALVGCLP